MSNGGYTPTEYMQAWVRAIFSVVIALAIILIFHNLFLGLLALTFFFFIPVQDIEVENSLNGGIFACLMMIILMLAFVNKEIFGLGLDFGVEFSRFAFVPIGLFVLVGFGRAAIIFAAPRGGRWAAAEFEMFANLAMIGTVALLIIVLQAWKWNTSTIIFTGIWLFAYLAGSTGDLMSRQQMGAILMTISFAIFSLGVGTQLVGTAMFGEWWPTVYQFGQSVFSPLGQMWSELTGTFGLGFQILTNPVGFAQSMMNGTYATDPLSGLRGAYGVEIVDFRTTPIFPYQPFNIIVQLKNQGAFDAKDITFNIGLGKEAPPEFTIDKLGLDKNSSTISGMARLDVQQMMFTGKITCETINEVRGKIRIGGLREYIIPLKGTVSYSYSIESTLDIQFLSSAEWERLVKQGQIITQTKKPSTFTNAPVRLNIDSMEQPIKEGTQFYIGIALTSAQGEDSSISNARVQLEIPFNITKKISCSTPPSSQQPSQQSTILTWEPSNWSATGVVYCLFDGLTATAIGTSKTFTIKAHANYTFTKSKAYPAKIEFGGGCCDAKDCPDPEAYICKRKEGEIGACVPKQA